MVEDQNQLLLENVHGGEVQKDPMGKDASPIGDSHRLIVPRRTRNHIEAILVTGILLFAFGLWSGGKLSWLTTWRPAASPKLQARDGDLESTPEVKYATRGGWIEDSGLWSKFGVLGAAFDGQKIVMSSAESARGSLGCWILPRERPMSGACFETAKTSSSKLPAGRTCSWEIVVVGISETAIRGARVLKAAESDPGCSEDYDSRPSPFMWKRP